MRRFYNIGFGLGLGFGFELMGKDLNGNGLWARKRKIYEQQQQQ